MKNTEIGKRIRQLRELKGWTQTQLAEKLVAVKYPDASPEDALKHLRAGQPQMSIWERGLHCPSYASILQLVKIFGVSTSWFERGEEDPTTLHDKNLYTALLAQHRGLIERCRQEILEKIHTLFEGLLQELDQVKVLKDS